MDADAAFQGSASAASTVDVYTETGDAYSQKPYNPADNRNARSASSRSTAHCNTEMRFA